MASVVGLNKVFILDKYFTELTKYWQSEYQLQERQKAAGSQQQQQQSNSYSYSQNYGHQNQQNANNKSQLFAEEGPLGVTVAQPLVSDINDLIHLEAPITEDSLIRALQARFNANECFTNIGPVLISINAFNDQNNALTLNSTYQHQQQLQQNGYGHYSSGGSPQHSPLLRVVHEAVRQQRETGYPQAIILSGSNGSGKTYASMVILRQLFNVVGGGPETDAFKHLAAAFTVLRSLGSASTINNAESSRIGNFIEVQVTDGAIYRTKIHCYFLDQSRVVRTPPSERNYHIFYQMLAGLSSNDKTKLYLDGYSAADFVYLNNSASNSTCLNYHQQDVTRFQAWKSCLSVLGIPFLDVVRVLAAVLLLGNVQFDQESSSKNHHPPLDINLEPNSPVHQQQQQQKKELQAVANLLGVSSTTLYKGLTTVTYSAGSSNKSTGLQTVRSRRTAASSRAVRDSLAKALYIRTVATIIRRANSSKRIGSSCGTTSSESNESIHQSGSIHNGKHPNSAGAPASSIGSACGKSYRTMAVLNSAVRYAAMDGFIGILDMFGFEDGRLSRLEQLCINLCAETMQHFYNTHIFKASIESCRDEGVRPDIEIDFVDNVPCIDFISSLRTGLFSLLDGECRKGSSGSSPETLVEKIKAQHYGSPRYFEVAANLTKVSSGSSEPQQQLSRYFGIRHFVADVIYDTSHFLEANSDRLCDDIVAVFHKSHCSFGFVSHLFGGELRQMMQLNGNHQNNPTSSSKQNVLPRGLKFRIAPTASHSPATSQNLNGGSSETSHPTTLTADFHNRLDNLLRTLVHARPHFVRCIKLNDQERPGVFERASVARQVRALQILETVNLMAGGLPHRMRFKAFAARYRLLVSKASALSKVEERLPEDCRLILAAFERRRAQLALGDTLFANSAASVSAVLGKKHIFLSESARQQLELVRTERRMTAAALIQNVWRTWKAKRNLQLQEQQWLQKCALQSQNRINFNSLTKKYPVSPNLVVPANNNIFTHRPARPQPITGTPPPPQHHHNHLNHYHQLQQQQQQLPPALQSPSEGLKAAAAEPPLAPTSSAAGVELCDFNMVRETCALFGIDLHTPPPLPPARPYSVLRGSTDNSSLKCHFPQLRVMQADYIDPGSKRLLLAKGQQVLVLANAASSNNGRRGFLVVQHPQANGPVGKYQNTVTVEVPHQFFEPSVPPLPPTSSTLPRGGKLGTLCI